ncbi:hypothetical protein LTR12_004319 [Friedmanniomyces endolithicus]|nr:hypothetical protein LTR74_005845 [Friedmanniomyces endolithicus]KAK1821261.1 hypothetical protein LTR12_004319 [Friedmanniomyces endolithicus]
MSDDSLDDNKDSQLVNSSSSQDVASTLQPTFRERRAHFSPFGEPLPPGEEEEPELLGRDGDDSPTYQRESQFPRSSSSYDVVDHRQQRNTFLLLSEDLTPQRKPSTQPPPIPRSKGTNDLAAMNELLPPAFYPQATEIFTAALGQEADRWWGKWAKRDYVVKVIFDRNYTATQDEVEVVREAFVEKWQEEEDEDDRSGAIAELETLKQGGDKSLRAYYYWALHLCRAARGEDSVRPSSAAAGSI